MSGGSGPSRAASESSRRANPDRRFSRVLCSVKVERAVKKALLMQLVPLAMASVLCAQAPPPMGPEFRVNTYTTGTQRLGSISQRLEFNDPFVIVWQSDGQDGSQYGIYAQRFQFL